VRHLHSVRDLCKRVAHVVQPQFTYTNAESETPPDAAHQCRSGIFSEEIAFHPASLTLTSPLALERATERPMERELQ
jgi:hypothetical protein